MNIKYGLPIALMLALTGLRQARAEILTVTFSGIEDFSISGTTRTGFIPEVPIDQGLPISGSFSVDNSVPGAFVTGTSFNFNNAIANNTIDLQIGGVDLSLLGGSSSRINLNSFGGQLFSSGASGFLDGFQYTVNFQVGASYSDVSNLASLTSLSGPQPLLTLFEVNNFGFNVYEFPLTSVAISSAVPEPSTWAMLILGFVGIGAMTYRRRKSGMLAA
jgi:PEP-CTERM motif